MVKQFFLGPYSSYPTYEEWKLGKLHQPIRPFASSYPTYEEWKPFTGCQSYNLFLLFLSYL